MAPPAKKLIYGSVVVLALGIGSCTYGIRQLYNSVPEYQQQPCSPYVHKGLEYSLRKMVAQQERSLGVSGLIYSSSRGFPEPPLEFVPGLYPEAHQKEIIIAR